MKELRYLNTYLVKYRKRLLLGLVFIIISTSLQIAPAPLIRHAIDLALYNIRLYGAFSYTPIQSDFVGVLMRGVFMYAFLILMAALLRGLFLFLVRQTVIVTSRLIEYDLKNEIYAHYQSLPMSFYRRNNTGDLLNRISEDVSRVRIYLGPAIMYGSQLVILFAMLIPYMFSISSTLTWYALSPLPILSFSIFFVNNIFERRSEEIQRSQSGLSTFVQEAFSGIRVLKSFNRESYSGQKFSVESDDYKQKSLKLVRVEALFFPLMMGLIGLSIILTVYMGGMEVIAGRLSFGHIAEFIVYVNLLTWPVMALGWTISQWQRAEASQKRINEFLKTKTDIPSGKEKLAIRGEVVFENISFVYPDSGIRALRNLSFIIHPGESLAIVGATGSGKTTIANLISRLYDPTQGAIYIDGKVLQEYDLSYLRSQIGVVPQDVFLFSDTIHNNIGFGLLHPRKEDIIWAAKQAAVYDTVMSFPKKFETRVGERGIMLSGGQKQRVSIARVLVRHPAVLILDDALSAVDTKTENAILNSMKTIMKDSTSIIISHRVSSAKLAHRIIVLDEGSIIEQGTHQELYAKKGKYYELYERQQQIEQQQDEALIWT